MVKNAGFEKCSEKKYVLLSAYFVHLFKINDYASIILFVLFILVLLYYV